LACADLALHALKLRVEVEHAATKSEEERKVLEHFVRALGEDMKSSKTGVKMVRKLLSFGGAGMNPAEINPVQIRIFAARSILVSLSLLFCVTLIPAQDVLAQDTLGCLEKQDFIPICSELTQQSRCSRELTRTCCECAPVWRATFEYCSFSLTLYPTPPAPTPTATPTATPTVSLPDSPTATPSPLVPVDPSATPSASPTAPAGPDGPTPGFPENPPEIERGGLRCALDVMPAQSSCDKAGHTMLLSGQRSLASDSTELEHSWQLDCGARGAALGAKLVTSAQDGSTLEAGLARLALAEPPRLNEVWCKIVLTVQRKPEVSGKTAPAKQLSSLSCGTVLLLNACELGCQSSYQPHKLVALDGHAAQQQRLVLRAANSLAKLPGMRGLARRHKADARRLYLESWQLVWTVPVLTKVCSNSVICSADVAGSELESYRKNAAAFATIARAIARKLRGLRALPERVANAQRTARRVAGLTKRSLAESQQVEARASRCAVPIVAVPNALQSNLLSTLPSTEQSQTALGVASAPIPTGLRARAQFSQTNEFMVGEE
jgi:hypothetical protein